jgi:hypothetical protein
MSEWVGGVWRTKAMGRCFQQSLRNMSNQHPSRKSDRESATTTTASQHQCHSEQLQCHSEQHYNVTIVDHHYSKQHQYNGKLH